MFEHKGVHQCTWHQDTLGRRSMIDFVVVSSDLRPYVLDTRVKRGAELVNRSPPGGELDPLAEEEVGQTWQTQTYCEGLLGTSGRALCQGGLQLPPPEELLTERFRGRLGTLSPSGPCSLPPLSTRQQFEVVDARSLVPVVAATPEPGGGHRKPSKPQPGRSWRQKLRVWEEFGEAMEEDYRSASKRFWQTVRRLRRGKQYSANTVYSAGWGAVDLELGTLSDGGRNTSRISSIPPTCLPVRKRRLGTSEVDSSITQAEVTEVVRKLLGGKAPGVDEIRPEYLKSLDVVRAVLADTPLQHCMEVGDSASGVANRGGGPSF
ncbi:hypothetical protein L3Q82_018318 [Scortum barcoo]|uniref:Uncharacterized protein n=1 Tax=Scortum barcoo TaxID=214431 RepID=A0ACB8VIG9_9TELE|nr:hypothetical protein L3Q82_018318 [Scortum barcoo]